MPQSYGGCATCADTDTTGTLPAGLKKITDAPLVISQGMPYEWRQVFVKSYDTISILKTAPNAGNGQLTVNIADHCLVVGDLVRLVNNDRCVADTNDAKSVFPIAAIIVDPLNAARHIITLTGWVVAAATYEATQATTGYALLGCAPKSADSAEGSAPVLMAVYPIGNISLTGGVWAGGDTYEEYAVSATAGSNLLYSTVRGKANVGDRVSSVALGIVDAVVRRVDPYAVKNTATGAQVTMDQYTLSANATVTSDCAAIKVQRGLLFPLEIRRDGNAFVVRIPERATSKLQLGKGTKPGALHDLGIMHLTAHWGELEADNQMRTMSKDVLSKAVHMRASHRIG